MGKCKKVTIEGIDKAKGMSFEDLMAMFEEVDQKDADDRGGAIDELLSKAIEEFSHNRGWDKIIECGVYLMSDGIQMSVGGSKIVKEFFEGLEGFDELIEKYGEQFAKVGHEFMKELSVMMDESGFLEDEEDGDDM